MELRLLFKKWLAHPMLPYILSMLVYGLIVGAIVQILIPGRAKFGWITTMIIGIAGAIFGGMGARYLGYVVHSGWHLSGFIAAVCGALVLLVLSHLLAAIID